MHLFLMHKRVRLKAFTPLKVQEKPIFHTCPDEGTALEYGFFDTYLVSQVTNIGCKPAGRVVTALIFSKYQNLPVS